MYNHSSFTPKKFSLHLHTHAIQGKSIKIQYTLKAITQNPILLDPLVPTSYATNKLWKRLKRGVLPRSRCVQVEITWAQPYTYCVTWMKDWNTTLLDLWFPRVMQQTSYEKDWRGVFFPGADVCEGNKMSSTIHRSCRLNEGSKHEIAWPMVPC